MTSDITEFLPGNLILRVCIYQDMDGDCPDIIATGLACDEAQPKTPVTCSFTLNNEGPKGEEAPLAKLNRTFVHSQFGSPPYRHHQVGLLPAGFRWQVSNYCSSDDPEITDFKKSVRSRVKWLQARERTISPTIVHPKDTDVHKDNEGNNEGSENS